MTELATINAKNSHHKAALRRRPLTFIAKWPWPTAGHPIPCETVERDLCLEFDGGTSTFHRGMVTRVLDDSHQLACLWLATEDLLACPRLESLPLPVILFARKIQLAILERLTG